MDYENTRTASMHLRLWSMTVLWPAFNGKSNLNFPWEKSQWDKPVVKKKWKVDIVNNDRTEAKVNRHVNHIGKPQRGVKLGTRVARKCLEWSEHSTQSAIRDVKRKWKVIFSEHHNGSGWSSLTNAVVFRTWLPDYKPESEAIVIFETLPNVE